MLGRTTQASKEYALNLQYELNREGVRAGIHFLGDPARLDQETDTCKQDGFCFLILADEDDVQGETFGLRNLMPGCEKDEIGLTLDHIVDVMISILPNIEDEAPGQSDSKISSKVDPQKLRKLRDMLRNSGGRRPESTTNRGLTKSQPYESEVVDDGDHNGDDEDDYPTDPRLAMRKQSLKVSKSKSKSASEKRKHADIRTTEKKPTVAVQNEHPVTPVGENSKLVEDAPKKNTVEETTKLNADTLDSILNFFMENPETIGAEQGSKEGGSSATGNGNIGDIGIESDSTRPPSMPPSNSKFQPLDQGQTPFGSVRNGVRRVGLNVNGVRRAGQILDKNRRVALAGNNARGRGRGLVGNGMRAAGMGNRVGMGSMGNGVRGGRMGNIGGGGMMNSAQNFMKENEICRDWLRNVCARGARCRYLHQTPQKQFQNNSRGPARAAARMDNNKVCRDWLRGICNRARCRFRHVAPNGRNNQGIW